MNYATNTAGEVVSEYNYLPYGTIDLAHSSGPDIARYKFATYERDEETGLDNANARVYNAASGMFLSADTVIPGYPVEKSPEKRKASAFAARTPAKALRCFPRFRSTGSPTGDGERSQGFNRYAYTEGMPTKYNDPSGHDHRGIFNTFPPWHNYTGPHNKENYDNRGKDLEPVTELDEISKEHDAAGAELLPIFGTSIEEKKNNINADAKFIGKVFEKLATLKFWTGNIKKAHEQLREKGWGEVGSWVGGVVLGTFYALTDIMYGIIGTALFTLNIVVTGAVLLWEKAGQGIEKLFSGKVKEFFDDLYDW